MVYELSLFNTILVILFIVACTILFIGSVLRFSWIQNNEAIRAKKHKQMYQCYIDSIKVLRISQMKTTGPNEYAVHQKYTKDLKNLYDFFGTHQQAILQNDLCIMNTNKTGR